MKSYQNLHSEIGGLTPNPEVLFFPKLALGREVKVLTCFKFGFESKSIFFVPWVLEVVFLKELFLFCF